MLLNIVVAFIKQKGRDITRSQEMNLQWIETHEPFRNVKRSGGKVNAPPYTATLHGGDGTL